jgi:NhaP-type Na+/H+ or K+/H+ antiporter
MIFIWASSTLLVKICLGFDWKTSMIIAGCVTPTDPMLANSIVKGVFADRHIPLRLRNLISAESAANGGLGLMLLFLPFFYMDMKI